MDIEILFSNSASMASFQKPFMVQISSEITKGIKVSRRFKSLRFYFVCLMTIISGFSNKFSLVSQNKMLWRHEFCTENLFICHEFHVYITMKKQDYFLMQEYNVSHINWGYVPWHLLITLKIPSTLWAHHCHCFL